MVCEICGHPDDAHLLGEHGERRCPANCAECGVPLDQINPECSTCVAFLDSLGGPKVEQMTLETENVQQALERAHEAWAARQPKRRWRADIDD